MPNRVRVLVVIDHLGGGGAQEFVYHLCRWLPRDRFRLDVLSLHGAGRYRQMLTTLGVAVRVLSPHADLAGPAPSWAALPALAWRLYRIIGGGGYDVVHTFLQASFALGTPLAGLARIPTIHTIVAVRAQTQRWYFPLMERYRRWVDLYMTFCPEELRGSRIEERRIKAVEVTADVSDMLGVAHDARLPIPPYALDEAFPVVVSIARLHPDKGHDHGIRAWPDIVKAWPSARLLVVGQGDDEPRLKGLAHRLGVARSVIFTGYRSDLRVILARADVFLRASVNEGVNLVTIQAMAAAVPVVGFRTAAPKEIVRHGLTGLLVPLGDAAALAQAIDVLARSGAERIRLGQRAREDVTSYYDIGQVAAVYAEAYEAVRDGVPPERVRDMSASLGSFASRFGQPTGAGGR